MKVSSLAILLAGPLVAAVIYPNLPVDFVLGQLGATIPLPQGFPWGTKTANNTDPYTDPPNTGVIRKYDFTISRSRLAPDGYLRDVLVINNQFPGPLIEANWGDTIQVTVHNKISNPPEGTSLHWHGLLQKASQWMDGVPGVSQCPIPPGGTFTYTFQADLYGTTWYHSHYSAQYAGGVIGPLIIHGPQTVKYDIDVGPILLNDYYHKDYNDIVEGVMSSNPLELLPASDNNMINGRNSFNCLTKDLGDTTPCYSNAGITSFKFTAGKTHRLRLINAGAEGVQKFSIDGHTLTVIANDFVPIIPYDTKVVTLGIGQRTDVIVKGIANASGSYLMRSSVALFPCSNSKNGNATAIVYYGSKAPSKPPLTLPWPDFIVSQALCSNDPLFKTTPWYSITPAPVPATTRNILISLFVNATGSFLWQMDGSSFRANYNNPILLLSKMGNNSYPYSPEWNVYNFGSNTSIRIVLTNPLPITHPIHLHGHNMQILNEGLGIWDGTIVNAKNPQRRDVQLLQGAGYMVLQIEADNPGAWPLHCHIAWHVSAGLYVTVLERPKDIAKLPIPSIMAQTCRDWSAFTNTTVVNQIDSGL